MHDNNKKWLDDLKKQYPKSFSNCVVLEVGSRDWNGSVRPWFDNCDYRGIDIEKGELVDEVVSAKKYYSEEYIDTIISFSVLEHDSDWKDSLYNLSQFTGRGTMLFMCWGAEGNIKHNEPWDLVPHQDVLDYLKKMNFKILDNFFEENRYGRDCAGCYNLVAKKK